MSGSIGQITWRDLTVPDAELVRDFYCDVVGWKAEPVEMGGYSDFNIMAPGSAEPVAGICHTRGCNAKMPAQWIMYVTVASVGESIKKSQALGGKLIDGPRSMGGDQKICVLQDPAGAYLGLAGPE
jgi:predicted enzyme related to lactoylglutathione lyase